jgi:hypothetical protein
MGEVNETRARFEAALDRLILDIKADQNILAAILAACPTMKSGTSLTSISFW